MTPKAKAAGPGPLAANAIAVPIWGFTSVGPMKRVPDEAIFIGVKQRAGRAFGRTASFQL
ncbi:hypothetical protein GCM10009628_33940 [Paeniglutamicibacter kerguelensis]